MAQWTGTLILGQARIEAQDNDSSSNFGVGASNALSLLNKVLMHWTNNVGVKSKYVGATTTGLSFVSGDVTKETQANPGYAEFESFHSAPVNTVAFPVTPALERVTVDEIQALLRYDGDNALTGQASDWTHVAAERTTDSATDIWRVWAYPVINRTRHLTVKAIPYLQIAAIGDTPDIPEQDARYIASFLAWEIARLNQHPQWFLNSILAPIPRTLVEQMHRGAVAANMLPSHVAWHEW